MKRCVRCPCYFHPLPAGGTLFPRWLRTGPFSSSDHRPVAVGELVLHRIPSRAGRLTHHSYNRVWLRNRLSLPNRQLEGGATERAKSNKYIIAARLFSYAARGFKLGGNVHLNCVSLRLATALRSTCSKGNVINTSWASEASRDWSWNGETNSRWIRFRIEILCLTG